MNPWNIARGLAALIILPIASVLHLLDGAARGAWRGFRIAYMDIKEIWEND